MLQGLLSCREVAPGQTLVCLKTKQTVISTKGLETLSSKCDMRREIHLLKHECKLHPFFRHALHIQEAVEFKIEFPLSIILSFLTACQSDGKHNCHLQHVFIHSIYHRIIQQEIKGDAGFLTL